MDHDKPADLNRNALDLRAEDLCEVETYFREKGCSEFEYDAKLDVFRFAEDGRFAFCRDFANWQLLEERGYLEY
jgi:hypothetical protein